MIASTLTALMGLVLSAPFLLDTAVPVVQASIHSVAPQQGAEGDLVQIAGTGFLGKRPRVWLVHEDTGRKLRQKVVEWSEESITIELRGRKLLAGSYAVRVCPCIPGAEPVVADESFQVMAPSITRYAPTWLADEDVLELEGRHFGSQRAPKVRIGGRRAKVQQWDDELLRVKLSKHKPPQGDLDVSVTTRAGTALGPCPLYVHGSSCLLDDGPLMPGQDCPLQDVSWIYVEVDGFAQWASSEKLVITYDHLVLGPPSAPELRLVVKGLVDPTGASASLWLTFRIDPTDVIAPIDRASLIEARYVSYNSPTDTRVWALPAADDPQPVEWVVKHCFSFAHLSIDLPAQGDYGPDLLHLGAILRVDSMALMGQD